MPDKSSLHLAWCCEMTHLEAEETNGADYKVFSGRTCRRQHGCHVIYSQGEEEEEPQQMTPDVYRLIG